jgi:hypothetical protein
MDFDNCTIYCVKNVDKFKCSISQDIEYYDIAYDSEYEDRSDNSEVDIKYFINDDDFKKEFNEIEFRCGGDDLHNFNCVAFNVEKFNIVINKMKLKKYYKIMNTYESDDRATYDHGIYHVFRYDNDEIEIIANFDLINPRSSWGKSLFDNPLYKFRLVKNFHNLELLNCVYDVIGFTDNAILCCYPYKVNGSKYIYKHDFTMDEKKRVNKQFDKYSNKIGSNFSKFIQKLVSKNNIVVENSNNFINDQKILIITNQ